MHKQNKINFYTVTACSDFVENRKKSRRAEKSEGSHGSLEMIFCWPLRSSNANEFPNVVAKVRMVFEKHFHVFHANVATIRSPCKHQSRGNEHQS